ncbi:MAG: hypothetical protein COT92_02445 [Candidatus Doudnabacteria bacterium CG10_big_fil_rev_8_21_14_0_10_42_18]|uniref:Uncharacterized protein n=1 Tax=Candidatus Doudnabacteria bacterium CG10_big_fil_rev_8_21_14_0_10_42_18 TaxID=1974552 RepID=A0A2H0VAR2_9BACT|nr:MAG: hypothetical protein COT92_02445 [Candidatus Doudnabacteria bacterium CG10_big_fil_rev_8_21_14_0_10_42_18]
MIEDPTSGKRFASEEAYLANRENEERLESIKVYNEKAKIAEKQKIVDALLQLLPKETVRNFMSLQPEDQVHVIKRVLEQSEKNVTGHALQSDIVLFVQGLTSYSESDAKAGEKPLEGENLKTELIETVGGVDFEALQKLGEIKPDIQ